MYAHEFVSLKASNRWWIQHAELFAASISGLFIVFGWLSTGNAFLSYSLYLLAFCIGGYAKAKEGILDSIRERDLNVELLMIFAAIGSAIIGYWLEGALLIFIFSLSGALETYTMTKSKKELSLLIKLQPEEAVVLRGDHEQKVNVSKLTIGEKILVKAGERIPADGIIVNGITTVDQSAITGEALPVVKRENDLVYAGTVNKNGVIIVTVAKKNSETLFSKIIELVQKAESEKSPSQLFIERVEGLYVKLVLLVVLITMTLPYHFLGWSWHESFYRAMVLMVVASPCALVASIMPATLSAISQSARKGVLIKGGVHLERLASTNVIVLDKTGTLTEGKPVVTDFITSYDDHGDLRSTILSIEEKSNHPLAKAIVNYFHGISAEKKKVSEVSEHPGFGMTGKVDGIHWLIGKAEFVGEEQASSYLEKNGSESANEGDTLVFVKKESEIVGFLALSDRLRVSTTQAVKDLKGTGVHTVMLTGDNEHTASRIAKLAEVDAYISNCLPEDKVHHVKNLKKQYGSLVMTGDGINDAPALATADVGIAMGEGTDVALETADIVLMKNDLSKIQESIMLARKMNKIIKQNLIFSIVVIALLILSNFFQIIDLPFGVIGHEGSTILVILNGLRCLR